MKIEFVLSDTTKDATTNILRKVVNSAECDLFKNHIVIVPETKSIIIEKELLSLSTTKSIFNVFVYSFVRLLDRFEAIPRDKLVSKQTCIILLRKIILENEDKLECYKNSAKMIGFAEKMYETIAQFKSSNITPDDLKAVSSLQNNSLKSKLQDIVYIYEEYEKALCDKLFDDCDKLSLISKLASENKLLKDSKIYVVGFDNITIEMQKVLRDIAKNCEEITFSCVYFDDKREDKFIQNNELYQKYKHIADSLNYQYVPQKIPSMKRNDFKILQYRLFAIGKRKYYSKGNVSVFEAKSQKQEIDYIANTILKEVEHGKRFRDIGVLSLNLTETLDIFEECFKFYDIPYFANVARKIDNHYLVKFIIVCFELIQFHLQREKVLEFVASVGFAAEDFSLFENYVDETGINYSEFTAEELANKVRDKYLREQSRSNDEQKYAILNEKAEKICSIIAKLQDFYRKFNANIKKSNKVKNYISAVNFLLQYFDIENLLPKISAFQSENNDFVGSQITDIILDKIDSFNNQILMFLGENEMSLQDFLTIYKTGFATLTVNLAPLSIDCVVIQENTDGFFNIKDMFLAGAIDGMFPTKISDTGIILDSELEETKQLIGKNIEPKVEEINIREKFRAYESLLEPTEKLFISYSLKSKGGKPTKCSRIVTDIIEMFQNNICYKDYTNSKYLNYALLENKLAQKINQYQNNAADLYGEFSVNYYYSLLGDNMTERFHNYLEDFLKPKSFTISNADSLYFQDGTTSVSKMQTYCDCPYKFFANYGLNLKDRKLAKANVLDIGNVIHRVAEIFGKNIKDYSLLNEEERNKKIEALLNQALEENKVSINKNISLIQLLLDECVNLCEYMIYEQKNSNFKIDQVEYKFSKENGIKIAISNQKEINIIGKIDRIDKFRDYVRVIDYKTGQITDNLSTIFYGTKIQLAIYLMAVRGFNEKEVAAILYFPIHSGYEDSEDAQSTYKMKGFVLNDTSVMMNMDINVSETNVKSNIVPLTIKFDKKTGEITYSGYIKQKYSKEEFDDICDYVDKLCQKALGEIFDGYIKPSPIASTSSEIPASCRNCKLFGFCGLDNTANKLGRNLNGKVDISSFKQKDNINEQ